MVTFFTFILQNLPYVLIIAFVYVQVNHVLNILNYKIIEKIKKIGIEAILVGK